MRKFPIVFLIILLLTSNMALAEDDLWDNFGDQNIYGQTPVTDEDFEATELYNEFESDLDHWLCKSDTAEPMLMVSGTPIKSCEKTFLDIKSLYEDKTNLTEKSLIEDENDDYIFDVLIEEVQSKKSKKVRKKEKVEDVEDLSDDDWEKLLNM